MSKEIKVEIVFHHQLYPTPYVVYVFEDKIPVKQHTFSCVLQARKERDRLSKELGAVPSEVKRYG
jgi:hypothetical protein